MMTMKSKIQLIPWLAPLAVLLCMAGCPVSINTGGDDGDDGPATEECPAAQRATVRIFHGAGGTPVTRPEFGPATTRNLNVVRPDLDPADPPVVASLAAGRSAIVQICGGKQVTLGARLVGAKKDRTALMITLTPDADPSKFDVGTTIVLAGISDDVKPDPANPSVEIGENPASATNPLKMIVVPETFSTVAAETQIQVVHVSRLTPTPIDVEVNPDSTGPEIMALERYEDHYQQGDPMFRAPVQTKGSADTAAVAVPIAFLQGASTKKSFSVPRVPAGAKVLAIHFDNEVYDPDNKDQRSVPAPAARLYLTGDDPLLGSVAGGGVTF